MGALAFSTTAKNLYLDALTKGTAVSASYQLNTSSTYVQLWTAGYALQMSAGNGTNVGACFTAPVAGVATFIANFIPNQTATGAVMRWHVFNGTLQVIADGTISTPGGGGNIIFQTNLSFSTGVAKLFTGTFKVPLDNGGTIRFSQALANAWANAILTGTNIPAMANGGVMTFYNGTMPATADTAVTTQTALATYTFVATDFGAATSGVSAVSASHATTWVANGTITWARWQKGGYVMDLAAGTAGADVLLDTTNCVSGTPPTITSFSLTMP